MNLVDMIETHCRSTNIHVCCFTCLLPCKSQYTLWTGTMPDSEYCEKHEQAPLWTYIIENIEEEVG